nr:DEAD/DEAH box helicase [bacterium]
MLAFSVVDSAHRQTDLVSRHREGWEALVAELEAPAEGSIQDVRLGILGRVLTRRVDPRVLVSPGCTRTIPFPHQVATCHRVINHMDGRAILADEVGLGKTIEAGMILTEYLFRGEANRVLVITPAGLTTQWQDELLDKFNLTFPIVDGRSGVGMVEGVKGHPRLITSLPFAKRPEVRGAFSEISWDLVIVDEAHHLRNPTTLNHRFVQSLSAKRLLLLTATPLQNSLTELFTLVDLVSPHIVDGSDLPKRLNRSIPPEDVVALRRALSGVMLRNRRCEVAGKGRLPPRTARTLRVRLSGSGKELYDAVSRYAVKGYRKSVASKHSAFGFFLMGIQRMLTSSVEALVGSLKRRIKKLKMHLGVRQKDLVKIREFLPEWETGKPVSKRIRRQLEKEIETLEGLVRLAGKVERHPKKSALLRYLRKLFREGDGDHGAAVGLGVRRPRQRGPRGSASPRDRGARHRRPRGGGPATSGRRPADQGVHQHRPARDARVGRPRGRHRRPRAARGWQRSRG